MSERGDLFEHAPVAYVVLDRRGGVVSFNEAFVQLVGRTRSELQEGTPFTSLLTVGGRIFHDTHLMPLLALQDRVDEVALEVAHPSGERIPVLLNANVDRPPDGEEWVVRTVLFPAAHRRRYEQDLLRATRTAEAAERLSAALSRTLQQTLIPPTPPVIDGLDLAAAYRPAGDGSEVGGDFYDVFQVGPAAWTVVLGDVVGKGIAAATVTSFVRHTVRGLAMQVADPAELLLRLAGAMRDLDPDRFCTVVVVRVSLVDGAWELEGSAGGHPLPLLRRADGTVVPLGSPGSLVGLIDDPAFTTFSHRLGPEEAVLLYTDGVTEAKHDGSLLGEGPLLEILAREGPEPARVTQALVAAALSFQGGHATDDIAVLTLAPSARPAALAT